MSGDSVPEQPSVAMTPRRTLVTGGAGFIGSHLVERLVARGDDVIVLDDLSTGRIENLDATLHAVRLIEADVRDVEAVLEDAEPFDEVYHLAAAVGVELVLAEPIRAIETNVDGTAAVLRYADAHGSPAVLVASSSEVYGRPGAHTFSEDDDVLYGPTEITRWSYACAKAIDEYLALGYHARRGLPAVVARFFNTIGPRQLGDYGMVVPRFVRAAVAGRPLRVFGDGSQSRCFCDVRDVVDVLPRMLAEPECHGRVFNVGSDESVTIAQLAERIIARTESASAVELVPYDEAYPAGFEDLPHRRPDLSRIRAAPGFAPTRSLEQTIDDIAAEVRALPTGGAAS